VRCRRKSWGQKKLGSGLEISFSAFCLPRNRLADGSIVNLQVSRNLFQQVPMSDMSMVDILIPLRLRL